MTISSIGRVLAVATLFLLVCSVWSNAQEQQQPSAPGVAEARELLKQRRYEEALKILRRLAKTRPVRKSVHFLIGLAAIESSRQPGRLEADRDVLLDEAITILRAMLINEPGLVRVRLELARAFFYKREDGLSTSNV